MFWVKTTSTVVLVSETNRAECLHPVTQGWVVFGSWWPPWWEGQARGFTASRKSRKPPESPWTQGCHGVGAARGFLAGEEAVSDPGAGSSLRDSTPAAAGAALGHPGWDLTGSQKWAWVRRFSAQQEIQLAAGAWL